MMIKHTAFQRAFITLFLVAGCLGLVGCGGSEGASSPEDVFQRAQAAARSADWKTMINCMAPDDRPIMTMSVALGAKMMVAMQGLGGQKADPAAAKGVDALLAKHNVASVLSDLEKLGGDGPSSEAAGVKLAREKFGHVDHAAFISEMANLMAKQGKESMFSEILSDTIKGDLSDLKIEGDRASGMAGGEAIHFIRIGSSWYMSSQ